MGKDKVPVVVKIGAGVNHPAQYGLLNFARPAKPRKLLTLFLSLCYIRNYVKDGHGPFKKGQVNVNLEAKK
jgi:hypothetical protein